MSGFALEGGATSPIETLGLGLLCCDPREGNIFPNSGVAAEDWVRFSGWEDPKEPGGWVEGNVTSGAGAGQWLGNWGGAFFGNGDLPTDHPSAFVGTFGAYNAIQGSIAGAFGAHKQ